MFGLRSARGRAILVGMVPVLLLVGLGALAAWRARADGQLHQTLGHTSAAATTLERAHARFWQTQATLSALVLLGDPTFVDDYDNAFAATEQDLAEARAELLAIGEAGDVSALDDLTGRIDQFNQKVRPVFPTLIGTDRQAAAQLAAAATSDIVPETEAIIADLEEIVQQAQQEASVKQEAANRAADVTLWLLLGLGGAALVTGIGTTVMLVGSVVGPLAALRASASAIASGNSEARARESGPEEVASLARDFNEMTDALAAKTQVVQESERRYRLLAENASDIIWTLDMNLRFTYESPSVTRIRGYSPEEAMAQTMEEALTPDSLELARKILVEELAIEGTEQKDLSRSRTLEVEQYCKDGSTVWLEVTMTFLRDEDSRPVGILGVSREITKRKRALEALRESEARYKALFAGAPVGMLVADQQTKQFRYANPAVCRMFGYTEEEVLRIGVADIHPKESLDHVLAEFEAQARGEKLLSPGLPCLRKDGTVFYANVSAITTVLDGRKCNVGIFSDVTERKRVEEALRESEARYKALFAGAPVGMLVADQQTRQFPYVNPAVCRMFGYTEEEFLRIGVTDIHPKESLDQVLAEFEAQVRGEKLLSPGLPCLRKDGTLFYADISGIAIVLDGRKCNVGIFTDITERKRAEQELRETRDYLEKLIDHANAPIIVWDPSFTITRFNDASERLTGRPANQVIGQRLEVLFPEHERAASMEQIARTLRGEFWELIEIPILHQSGEVRQVLWNSANITGADGRTVVATIAQGTDITERKQMEEALRENERRYRLITENTADVVWTQDMSLRYTYVSPAITRMRGYTPEEIVGLSIRDTMTPASLELAAKILAEQLALEGVEGVDPHRATKIELEMCCKDGSTIWTEMNMTFMRDSNGRPVGILGITRNISERKRTEEERERLHAELEERAITDSLTGLYNHAHFFQRLAEETKRSKRYNHGFAVVMMDVDNFKRFNDSHGHQMGDEVLRLVADSIRSGLRRSDLAFRYGGDEFAAILPHTDATRARAVIDRINRRLAKSLKQMNDGAAARVSLSAGAARFPEEGSTAEELVRVADAALYSAKWAAGARDAIEEGYAVESLAPAAATPETGLLSTQASSLAEAPRELGVPDALADLNLRTVATLGTLAEIKDPFIRGHQERTSEVAASVGEEMGLSPERVRGIRLAGLVHDLGKAGISKRILNKPGKLTEEEFAEIKEHPPLGSMMIISEIEALRQVVPIVLHHHEHFDGKGYPAGLAGEEIPIEARILAVVDAFDAMTHERAYRKAMSREEALAELQRGTGTQFDPAVVEAFLALAATEGAEPEARKQPASADKRLATVRTTKTPMVGLSRARLLAARQPLGRNQARSLR